MSSDQQRSCAKCAQNLYSFPVGHLDLVHHEEGKREDSHVGQDVRDCDKVHQRALT